MKAGNDKTALGWSLVISGLVHTLSGVVAAAATSLAPGAPVVEILPPLEYIVIEPISPSPPSDERIPAPEAVVVPSPREVPSRASRPETATVAIGTIVPDVRPEEPEPREKPEDERPVVRGVPGGLRLDPRAVAMAAIASEGPSAAHASAQDAPPLSVEQRTAELNREHSRFLSETANAQAWVTRKEPPKFERRRDGSFVYRGHAFSAKIQPDGTIVFSDRDKLAFSQTGTNDGQSLGARFSFDLTDGAYRRRGADPYQAERDYVLRGSEELRDQLAVDYREKEGERALLRLAGRLERMWTSGRDPAARRRAVFELWDDCSDDDVGARARAAIISFVAERLPAGSDDAFSADELARLNESRRSRESFRPYR